MNRMVFAAFVLVPALVLAAPKDATRRSDVQIDKLVLRISESESAQVFHVVDQLSAWSEFSHRQYGRWAAKALTLNDADRKLLARHAELRKAHGWGNGFEQTFYVDASIADAAENGLRAGGLSPEELKEEKEILLHFAPMVRPMIDAGRDESRLFRERLAQQAKRIAPTVAKLARFTGTTEPIVVPVFLIPNPEKGTSGGGYNGGRLVLEIQADPDPMPTLLHECLHAFLDARIDDIESAVKQAHGLDVQLMSEGIAYALAPGILTTSQDGADELSEWLAIDVLRGMKPTDPYLRFRLLALIVRPLLRDALDHGGTLRAFLPRAVERWNHVQSRQ